MASDEISESLERCFISPNVLDSNMENCNVVDVLDAVGKSLHRISNAITPSDQIPFRTEDGLVVGNLTEAVFYAGQGLHKIASALDDIASAINRFPSPKE